MRLRAPNKRLGDDLLATAARMERSRRVEPAARTCEPKGGRANRPVARRPLASWQQAPPDFRRQRDTAGVHADRRAPSRRHATDGAGGSSTADRPPRQVPPPPPLRRPSLRLQAPPQRVARTRHHTPDRQAENRPRLRPGQRALGGGAHDLLAARPPLPRPPARPPRRHPRSHANPRLRPHLPQTSPTLC